MLKRITGDPSYYLLLTGNLFCIWYYTKYPGEFSTIVWIYWCQSVTIGFFNFLELQLISSQEAAAIKMNDKPATKGCLPWFFLCHFGIFHLVYFIFLLVQYPLMGVHKKLLLLGVAIFFIESIIGFYRHFQVRKTKAVNAGALFFLPYLRIIPMHLMILLPSFFGWQPSVLFLVLKMLADLLSYRLYRFAYAGRNTFNTTY